MGYDKSFLLTADSVAVNPTLGPFGALAVRKKRVYDPSLPVEYFLTTCQYGMLPCWASWASPGFGGDRGSRLGLCLADLS
jgi:hypothetical protein